MIVVGEALVDLVEESDGRLDPRPGGAARNLAVAAARLGGTVHYVGGLSQDTFGQRILRELVEEGVDVSHSPVVRAPTPLAVVTLDDAGVAEYAFHLAETAALALGADDLASLPGDAPLQVSLGAVTLATPGIGDALVALLASHDALTGFDPNVRPAFLTDREADAARVDAAVSVVDLVRCSEEDIALLHPERGYEEVARDWLGTGAGAVVVTRGAEGAVAFAAGGRVRARVTGEDERQPPVSSPTREPGIGGNGTGPHDGEQGDTVGAGDTFGGALLVTLVERGVQTRDDLVAMSRDDWLAALRFAVRAAGITVQRRGADPPHRADL